MSSPEWTLSKLHGAYRDEQFPGVPDINFISWVCGNFTTLPEKGLGHRLHAPMVHWKDGWQWGWPDKGSPVDLLVILPSVSSLDMDRQRPLVMEDRATAFTLDRLKHAGVDLTRVAFTFAVRFVHPVPNRKFGVTHKNTNGIYALADVARVNPKVILAMGADAVKTLYGTKAKIGSMRGNVVLYKDTPVVPTDSPKSFLGGYSGLGVLDSEIKRAWQLVQGHAPEGMPAVDYRVCETREQVAALVLDIEKSGTQSICFDCEWGNDVAREEYSYTLSIQLCWAAGKAAFVKLRGEEGVQIHSDEDYQAIIQMLGDLMVKKELIGHNLRVDVNQFYKNGYNMDHKVRNGFCTMLVHHLLYNDDMQGLDNLCRKYTPGFGAYWQELEDWLDDNSRQAMLRFGYRNIPHHILIPYALKDVDVTWRCAEILRKELDAKPTLKQLYYNITAPAALHLMDLERIGLCIDQETRHELLEFYQPVADHFKELIRQELEWPDFNPGSQVQLKTALFSGHVYNEAKDPPPYAKTLGLQPLITSDKYPKDWAEVLADGRAQFSTPSTGNQVLETLYKQHPDKKVLLYLRHFSAVNKLISGYLADPEFNEFGVREGGDSLGANIDEDGRVRTRLSQLTATGRYTSSSPNLQTWPKKQERALLAAYVHYKFGIELDDYEARCDSGEISADEQVHLKTVKGCVVAPPGRVLIEVDFKTAELFVWAYMSDDKLLIKVLESGRDLHSENAAKSFRLPNLGELEGCLEQLAAGNKAPYKAWCTAIKDNYGSYRIAAKAIIFGVIYGRSANAIARALQAEGINVTKQDCQQIIDGIAQTYPVAWAFLERNARLAIEQEYVENAFGRRKMFTGIRYASSSDQAGAQRQGKNAPVQGSVGDLLAQAGRLLYDFRYHTKTGRELGFDVILPVHDAFLVETDEDKVDQTVKVLELCMSTANKIGTTPYHLDIDVEIMQRWGEHA